MDVVMIRDGLSEEMSAMEENQFGVLQRQSKGQ